MPIADIALVNTDTEGQLRQIGNVSLDATPDGRYVLVGVTDPIYSGVTAKPQYFLKEMPTGSFGLAPSYGGNAPIRAGDLSFDAQLISVVSGATNLVANDTNGQPDLFVGLREQFTRTRVNTSSDGAQDPAGIPASAQPDLAEGGRYVVFASGGSTLVPGDANGAADAFRKDLLTGEIVLVSANAQGTQGDGRSEFPSVSADGRIVAFQSTSTNLAPGAGSGTTQVYWKDMATGEVRLVSEDTATGAPVTGMWPHVSADGRYVAFLTGAGLVPQDTNGYGDIYVRDMATGQLWRASEEASGASLGWSTDDATISDSGRFVGFGVRGEYFIKDLQTGELSRVNGPDGAVANATVFNGRFAGENLVFTTEATNLVAGVTGFNAYILSLDPDRPVSNTAQAYTPSYAMQSWTDDLRLMRDGPQNIVGNARDNQIWSNAHGSTIDAGGGADTVVAGAGGDAIRLGAGADVVAFATAPGKPATVSDFVAGTDRIDVRELLKAAGYAGTDPIGDGYIRFVSNGGGGTSLLFDRDGAQGPQASTAILSLPGVQPDALGQATLVPAAPPKPPEPDFAGRAMISSRPGDWLLGTSGSDTLYAGRGPDSLTGEGGRDVFVFREIPYNAGRITDFKVGVDRLDISAIFQASSYTGADPVADGYLRFASDGSGGTLVTFDTDGPAAGNTIQFIITRLNGVSPVGLKAADVLASGSPEPPPQGAQGKVLSARQPGDTLTGGPGDDTLNASQGSDILTGGGGADTFAWAREPWSPATVKDFLVGADRLDLSSVFRTNSYAGSDPIADGRIVLLNQGADTLVLFDDDGQGGDWPNYIIKLEGVATSGLTWAKLSGSGGPTDPPPPPPSGDGRVIDSSGPGATLTGTAGNDTLNSSRGSDVLTGAGGADHFVFAQENWSPARITDFEHGVDRIDIRGMLDAIGYTGSDPFAAGYLSLLDDGAGGAKVLFDRDAAGPEPQWANYVIHVEHVSPAELRSADDWIFQ